MNPAQAFANRTARLVAEARTPVYSTETPKPFSCGCEHISHDSPNEAIHPMFANVESTPVKAAWVGDICTDCATNCIPGYVIR